VPIRSIRRPAWLIGCSLGERGTVASMENLTCPRCGNQMVTRALAGSAGEGGFSQCPEGHGVFLARPDLGSLIEAENDWHRNASQQTAPIPRITPGMQAPPSSRTPARAWVETLFG
jgi:Zn-finger nucleic acid-binding protein